MDTFGTMATCKNCDASLSGPFCAACGQKADTRRISWAWLGHELQHSLFHVDKGLWLTLRELLTRPGHAIREFLEGQRVRRFKPFATLIVLATVYSLLYRWMGPDTAFMIRDEGSRKVMEVMNKLMGQYYALLELATLPGLAFFSWLWMRKYGHNFVEHLVIQAYITAQRIAVSTLFLPLNVIGAKAYLLGTGILSVAYMAGYLITFAQLYANRPAERVVLRSFAALSSFVLTLLVLSLIGGVIAVLAMRASG